MSWPCLYSIDCSRCLCELANCYGSLRHGLQRFSNLVELSYCKLKKIYALCENFIYIGPLPVLSPGRSSVPGLTGLMGLVALVGLAGLTGLMGLAVIYDNNFLSL